MQSSFNDSINDVSARVQSLEFSSKARPPPKKGVTHTHRLRDWADWEGNTDLEDLLPAASGLSDHKEDNDQEKTPAAISLSLSKDRAFLVSAFTSTLLNMERRNLKSSFPCPSLTETRCPCLDPLFKTPANSKETKSADADLFTIQAFMHDPIGPLMQLFVSLN
uniref:Uncharacterized protein n=1 Tax=Amphimedon queenslandica TaxID=400682 RepID=A0A1X7TMG2_AMPQE